MTAWLLLRAYTYGRWGANTRDHVSPWSDGDGSGFADYDTDTDPSSAPAAVAPLPPLLDDAPAEVIRQVADRQHGYVRDGLNDLQVFLTQQDRRTQDDDK